MKNWYRLYKISINERNIKDFSETQPNSQCAWCKRWKNWTYKQPHNPDNLPVFHKLCEICQNKLQQKGLPIPRYGEEDLNIVQCPMCKRWEGYTKNQPINNNKETVSHGICLDCRRKVKMNWYNQYNNNLEKEAGAKNYLGQMALAISLFFSGEDLLGASNKARVHPQELKINVDKMKGMTNEQKMQYLDKLKGIPTKQKSNVELQKQKPQSLEALTTIEILARTIYAEAEGEPYEGKHAVASVIYNRSNGDVNQMVNVVKSRKQFSCWNSGCPTPGKGKAWEDSLKIAKELINGTFKPTVNYTHYYNPSKANPNWGNVKDYKMIGRHKFLNPSNS